MARCVPALGFVLSQGFGRGLIRASPWSRPFRDKTCDDRQSPCPISRAPSARGFAAPFLRRCARHVRLHPLARSCLSSSGVAGPSAYYEADASPILRSISAGPAPCLRFFAPAVRSDSVQRGARSDLNLLQESPYPCFALLYQRKIGNFYEQTELKFGLRLLMIRTCPPLAPTR